MTKLELCCISPAAIRNVLLTYYAFLIPKAPNTNIVIVNFTNILSDQECPSGPQQNTQLYTIYYFIPSGAREHNPNQNRPIT